MSQSEWPDGCLGGLMKEWVSMNGLMSEWLSVNGLMSEWVGECVDVLLAGLMSEWVNANGACAGHRLISEA